MKKGTQKQEEKEGVKVHFKLHITKNNLIRVKGNYILLVENRDELGNISTDMIGWSKDTLKEDNLVYLIEEIDKYYNFRCKPSHTDYRRMVDNGYYNLYEPLSYKSKEGSFTNIMALLNQVFGIQYLDFILDYLQILYMYPERDLPIILLESTENSTGKSTFFHLVRKMFEKNTITLGNSDLMNKFNEIWLNKSVIMVEETAMKDTAVKEMIKSLSTNGGNEIVSNGKNTKQVLTKFFGKFMFNSNNEGHALPITKEDIRFAVFKPKSLGNKTELGEDFKNNIELEVPAFVHYLLNRTLLHPDKGRMYFEPKVYFTDQLKVYHQNSKSDTVKAIEDMVKDTFEMFQEVDELEFSLTNIFEEIVNGRYLPGGISRVKIRTALEAELSMMLKPKARYDYYSRHISEKQEYKIAQMGVAPNTFYTFYRHNYFGGYENSTKSKIQKMEQGGTF